MDCQHYNGCEPDCYRLKDKPEGETEGEVSPDDLMGTGDVARYLGVSHQVVGNWVIRGKMPQPFARPSCGPIWLRQQIDQVAAERAAQADLRRQRLIAKAESLLRKAGEL